jgi:hypothetical protein
MAEDLGTAKLPFGLGKLDLTNPGSAVTMIVALVLGATVWNMSDSIGQNLASRVNNFLGNFLPGGNPATSDGPVEGV